jgi:Xaa-Pro aminopeptidase
MDYLKRQKRMAASLEGEGLDGFLVTHLPNIRYLTGFAGSSAVLAIAKVKDKTKSAFFTDGRYLEQAREQVQGAKVAVGGKPALGSAIEWLKQSKTKRVGFEALHMTVAIRESLGKTAAGKLALKPTRELVERLRMIKEPAEVAQMRAAVLLASSVFDAVVNDIKPGVPESSIAAEIEYMCRRMGAEGMSFDTLVSAGARSAMPHGVASQNPVPGNGFVILDFGVILGGYCSDMTRTVHVGAAGKKAKALYAAVKDAQLAGIAAVRAGVETWEVDYAARKVLVKAGLGRYFTHSTGHGVGLEIHEPPGLRKAAMRTPVRTQSKLQARDRLEAGMVVTIEPGAYIPGQGGVRIEDMVVVTAEGCEVLTPTRKDLIVL